MATNQIKTSKRYYGKDVRDTALSYLKMGRNGHIPLLEKSWLEFSANEDTPLALHEAQSELYSIFEGLLKYRDTEAKRKAIRSFSKEQKRKFARSFVRLIECDTLKDMNVLQ